jgi:hypothetical protein
VPMAKKVARERPGQEGIYAGACSRRLAVLVCGGARRRPRRPW